MQDILKQLGIEEINSGSSTGKTWIAGKGKKLISSSPVDGKKLAEVISADKETYEHVITTASTAFAEWKLWPSPKRGEVVRQFAEALRKHKEPLGKLVSYEMGKSLQEGYGEVQEMIDICDFAVGLSRQLHGLTMHSERPGHRM
ncbi:MAG: aldehyde dehydrogenase family protein, partial [Bacteroidota bacterium]|nr:aldehyde dehydrogenase family protein [Bacteroidota bacterium]